MNVGKNINYEFKLLYAVAIMFIVCGHCGSGGINIFFDWFPPYSFHLGMFMFASGYFYRDKDEQHIGKSIWHKVKKVIIPMYLYNFFYAIVVIISRHFGFSIGLDVNLKTLFVMPLTGGDQYMYNLAGWFLIPLVLIYIFHLLFQKLLGKYINEYITFAIYLALGLWGSYLSVNGISETWYGVILARCMYMFPFYGFGILYRRKLEHGWKINSWIYFGIIFGITLAQITYFGNVKAYTPSWCNDFDSVVRPHLIGFLGLLFWLRICKILAPIVAKNKIVLLLADNTYAIMINHLLGFMVAKTVFASINKITHGIVCGNFDWIAYKSDLWYYYLPKDLPQWNLVYAISGILISLFIQKIINESKKLKFFSVKNKYV